MNRRHFLKLGLAGAALGALPLARAGSAGKRLIIVLASGGWDPTWLFDPKPDSPDVQTAAGDWQRYGELDLWRTDATEQAHLFLQEWGSVCGVVNGLAVNSLVHEECVKRVLTGSADPKAPDLGSRVAAELGHGRPLPYLVRGGSARTAGFEAQAGAMGWANQLSSLLADDLAYAPGGGSPFRPSAAEDAAVHAYLEGATERLVARTGNPHDSERVADYLESLARASAIRDGAADSFLSDPELFETLEAWPHAVRALGEEFSQVVYVEDDGYWDTHFDNSQQGGLFDALFGGLRQLLGELWDRGGFEDTVVMVASEMGRTPVLNGQDGKDHWPFTSALIVGEGVRAGLVQGTDGDLRPRGVDPATGGAGGHELGSADVLATVAELVGLDGRALYPDAEVLDALVG